jgi:hypothetical protein
MFRYDPVLPFRQRVDDQEWRAAHATADADAITIAADLTERT